MQIGVVLGQHRWEAMLAWARRAESLGLESVWLADHDGWYQAAVEPGLEPLTALAGLARATTRVRLGGLLSLRGRPPALVAKALATTDRLSHGRLVLAMTTGTEQPGSSAGAEQLGEAVQIVQGAFGGGPFSFEGSHYRVEALRCRPRPVQQPGPPVWVTGGREVLAVAARHADGWVWDDWAGTLDSYRSLGTALDRACEELGRDPASLPRAVCRRALVGESEAHVRRGWEEVGGGTALGAHRRGHLVGAPEQVREQVLAWERAGVATLIVHPGALAWTSMSGDDLDLLASAVSSRR